MMRNYESRVQVTFFPFDPHPGRWIVSCLALNYFYFAVIDDFGDLVKVGNPA